MTEIQNLKCFKYWKLEFGICLKFGACDLVLYNLVGSTVFAGSHNYGASTLQVICF